MTARTAALVLQARNVSLADVYDARSILEPSAVRLVASSPGHRAAADELRPLIRDQQEAIGDPETFGLANARFHARLVELAGNQTLSIVAEMLNEVVARAVTAVSQADAGRDAVSTRRRGIRSQERLVSFIEEGQVAEAEEHWRTHMAVVGRVMLGQDATTVIDLMNHY
jgi:GntR family transcriptional regulator, transcriptional repressor for pyruvate dehydrogenase complex